MELFNKKKQEADSAQNFRAQRRTILNENSDFTVKEAYKTLRTNIRFSQPEEGCRKICITSGMPGEGKSITSLNVAISFAESGQRVLLIDADLRRPTLARLLIENGTPGLSNLLAGMCKPEDAIHPERYPNLDIIFSGMVPPNPSELLGSSRMEKLLDSLAPRYDYIFIDTPPVNVVTDACVISAKLDGTLIVARRNRSDRDTVSRCVNQMKIAGGKILGFVLNGADLEGRSKYSKHGYNAYRYDRYYYEMRPKAEEKTQTEAKPRPKAAPKKSEDRA